MIDPDLLAIQRARRQAGRCVRCGRDAGCAALCRACRADWRYCPRCEAVYPCAEASRPARPYASNYCKPCSRRMTRSPLRRAHGYRDYATYLADIRERTRTLVPKIAWRVRRGMSEAQVGRELGLTRNQVHTTIQVARDLGWWPVPSRRKPPRADDDGARGAQ